MSRGTESEAHLLLVEDDGAIRGPLLAALREEGFTADFAVDLADARRVLGEAHELVLLDLGLPDGDGLDVCRELRAQSNPLPVIVLTARDRPEQRVGGLEAGADDYVVKPFHLPELLARIRSVLRRAGAGPGGGSGVDGRIGCRELWADPLARRAGKGNRELELRRREFDLLVFLLAHPGRAWTRDQLVDRVWSRDFAGDPRTVDLHVRRLRAQIEDDPGEPKWLQTVWGVGYRMVETDGR